MFFFWCKVLKSDLINTKVFATPPGGQAEKCDDAELMALLGEETNYRLLGVDAKLVKIVPNLYKNINAYGHKGAPAMDGWLFTGFASRGVCLSSLSQSQLWP